MKRAPELERDQAPEESRALGDVVEKLPAAPDQQGAGPLPGRAAAVPRGDPGHDHAAPRPSPAGARVRGRLPAEPLRQLDGLADPATSPAYGDRERLVIRYTGQLTVAGEVDDALHTALARHLSNRELIELALTVAAANFSNRVNSAFKLGLEHS
jgi:hypothetical protein